MDFAQLHEKADRPTTVAFLEELLEALPYALHTARTRVHRFDQICREHDIEHRLTKPNHAWANGQVERIDRTIKDATLKRYCYDSHDERRQHLQLLIGAYNHGPRSKTEDAAWPHTL